MSFIKAFIYSLVTAVTILREAFKQTNDLKVERRTKLDAMSPQERIAEYKRILKEKRKHQ